MVYYKFTLRIRVIVVNTFVFNRCKITDWADYSPEGKIPSRGRGYCSSEAD